MKELKRKMKTLGLEEEDDLFFRFLQKKRRDDLWFQHDERRLSLGSILLMKIGQVFLVVEEKECHWFSQEMPIWEKELVLQMKKKVGLMKGP